MNSFELKLTLGRSSNKMKVFIKVNAVSVTISTSTAFRISLRNRHNIIPMQQSKQLILSNMYMRAEA